MDVPLVHHHFKVAVLFFEVDAPHPILKFWNFVTARSATVWFPQIECDLTDV